MTHPQLTRLRDWPERLDALLRARAETPFAWGHNDCCIFAADVVQALTGHDPMRALRGLYASRRDAQRLLGTLGGFEATITGVLGPRISSMQVTVGDVLLIHNAGREMLAVCNGVSAVAPGRAGLVAVPVVDVRAAWRAA